MLVKTSTKATTVLNQKSVALECVVKPTIGTHGMTEESRTTDQDRHLFRDVGVKMESNSTAWP